MEISRRSMVQSLDFILIANRNSADKKRITDALMNKDNTEIFIGKFKMKFDPESRYVTVDKASEDVPFATKIVKCRIPYDVIYRLLDGNYNDLTGIEWL